MNKSQSLIAREAHRKELSALEDSLAFVTAIQEIASSAAITAATEAKVLKIPVTYLRGSEIIKKFPDGSTQTIGYLGDKKKLKSLRKGTVLHARKK